MKKVVIFLFTVVLLTSCGGKTEVLTGYIPADAKPIYVWTERMPGSFQYESMIQVISDKGDSLFVNFYDGTFFGGYSVRFKDTYPPAVGNKVYVQMYFRDSAYTIVQASLYPYPVEK